MVSVELRYHPPSLIDVFLHILVMTLVFNVFLLPLAHFIFNKPVAEIFNDNWLVFLAVPAFTGMIYALINRTGSISVKDHRDAKTIRNKVVESLNKRGLITVSENEFTTSMEYGNLWQKILNLNKGSMTITLKGDELKITGKRNLLLPIEEKLKWNKDFADFKKMREYK